MVKHFYLLGPETYFDRFDTIPYCYTYNISRLLKAVNIAICDFIINFINNPNNINNLDLIFIQIHYLCWFMLKMEPISGHEREVWLLSNSFYRVLFIFQLQVVYKPGSVQWSCFNAFYCIHLVLCQMLLLAYGIFAD